MTLLNEQLKPFLLFSSHLVIDRLAEPLIYYFLGIIHSVIISVCQFSTLSQKGFLPFWFSFLLKN